VVGGHTNVRTDRGQLSVAILGRANKLLTSFDAEPGDVMSAAIDLRGRYREPFSNWEAATDAPPARLRGDIELLPLIAEAGLSRAAKDISQGGIVGTAAMLAECSGVAIDIDLASIPKPAEVALERWLLTFPSFGYLLSVKPANAAETIARFSARGIAAATIGSVAHGSRVTIGAENISETIWDFAHKPLIGAGTQASFPMEAVA
jgi:selenophosphate synthetase-related protein